MRKGYVDILLKKDGCKDIKVKCHVKVKLHPVVALFAMGCGLPLVHVKPIDWKGVLIGEALFFTIFLSCAFFMVSIAFGIIALGGAVVMNCLYSRNYFFKYIQKKLREGYQVEDQEHRQILENGGVLPLVEKPSNGFQLPNFSGLNVKKILSVAGGAIAVIFLLSLFFGGDTIDRGLDHMEAIVSEVEKLAEKLEAGKISSTEFEIEMGSIVDEVAEVMDLYDDEGMEPTPEQIQRANELMNRMEAATTRATYY